MGNPAVPMTLYRDEYIALFERRYSLLKMGCVRETLIRGNTATFLVSGSGNEVAVSRGSNGQIPYKTASNSQTACTLIERHAPFEITGFDVFANQGDQRKILMMSSQDVMNRDIDQKIIDQLDTATQTTGSAVKASLDLVTKAKVILGNSDVDTTQEDKMFAAVTPAFMGYLEQIPEFSSSDYVDVKVHTGPSRRMRRWKGINWIEHTGLTGKGTSAEKCYLWHMDAMGHAANTGDMIVDADYDRKQQVSWTNATCYHNAVLLQNTGIVQMLHDGSAYVAS